FTSNSTGSPLYRPGRAIVRSATQYDVAYFAIEAVLAREFRKSHCFWIAGIDSAEGGRRIRLAFAPAASVRGPDWEGELVVDTAGVLRRSLARLVVARPSCPDELPGGRPLPPVRPPRPTGLVGSLH
ncbi:MAG TPA: hypothetical protein VLL51_07050, partial [Gemmatimonadales bacterium]|nr:hypothetical protein [Gemmatimonadales bacterium]